MTMSNGAQFKTTANSLLDAVNKALESNLGQTVKSCYSGLTQEDVDKLRLAGDKKAIAGIISHDDIPNHDPLPLDFSKIKKRRKPEVEPCALFNDTQIQEDSLRALHKAEAPVFK